MYLMLIYGCWENGKYNYGQNASPIVVREGTALDVSAIQSLQAGIKAWYDSVLLSGGFNGGILVAKNGHVIFENYRGNVHIYQQDTITATTPFHIASTSKTFTAMAILKLWQEGKLKLTDEFAQYFPEFNYPGVTIKSLLSHRSGLPNYTYFMDVMNWDKSVYFTNKDLLQFLITHKNEMRNVVPPETHFSYCNTNYALLALLIEKLSGLSYANYLKTNFFEPLHMTHSFVFSIADSNTVTPSYDWKGRLIPLNFLDVVYGDKNIYSTPQDLLKWERGLSASNLFADSTLQAAYQPYSNEKKGTRNYGLGWRLTMPDGANTIIYHNGWWHGNNATFIRLLKDSVTIIVLGNKFNRKIYHAKAMCSLFGNYGISNVDEEGGQLNDSAKEKVHNTDKKEVSPPIKTAQKKLKIMVEKSASKNKSLVKKKY